MLNIILNNKYCLNSLIDNNDLSVIEVFFDRNKLYDELSPCEIYFE